MDLTDEKFPRYHRLAAEAWGKLAGYALVRSGRHAIVINDWLTYERCVDVLDYGIRNGWDESNPTSKITPNRAGSRHTSTGEDIK